MNVNVAVVKFPPIGATVIEEDRQVFVRADPHHLASRHVRRSCLAVHQRRAGAIAPGAVGIGGIAPIGFQIVNRRGLGASRYGEAPRDTGESRENGTEPMIDFGFHNKTSRWVNVCLRFSIGFSASA